MVWRWLAILVLLHSCEVVRGDPLNLVDNGNFERMGFVLGKGSQGRWEGKGLTRLDVEHGTAAAVGALPAWRVVGGGVQVLSNADYASASPASSFCVHLNSHVSGPGTLRTMPLFTPRAGARYTLAFSVTVNPDGGPLSRSLNVTVFRKGRRPVTASVPPLLTSGSFTRSYLIWKTYHLSFIGNNRNTYIEFASSTPGKYGLLLDDVVVSLVDLLGNGGFDYGSFNVTQLDLSDGFVIIDAPSSTIPKWFVSSGSVKYSKGHYVPSDSLLSSVVDLNGDSPGALTTSFPSRHGVYYQALFDFAANPEANLSIFEAEVAFFVTIVDGGQGIILSNQAVTITPSFNQSLSSITWQTGSETFAAMGSHTNVTFISQIPGKYGPLIDNIHVYELQEQSNTKAYSINSHTTQPQSSAWRGVPSIPWKETLLLVTCVVIFCIQT